MATSNWQVNAGPGQTELLPTPPAKKKWHCKAGHERMARTPFAIALYMGEDEPPIMTGSICPFCLSDMLTQNIGMEEVDEA